MRSYDGRLSVSVSSLCRLPARYHQLRGLKSTKSTSHHRTKRSNRIGYNHYPSLQTRSVQLATCPLLLRVWNLMCLGSGVAEVDSRFPVVCSVDLTLGPVRHRERSAIMFCRLLFQDLKQIQLKQRPSAFRPWSPRTPTTEKEKSNPRNEAERCVTVWATYTWY